MLTGVFMFRAGLHVQVQFQNNMIMELLNSLNVP